MNHESADLGVAAAHAILPYVEARISRIPTTRPPPWVDRVIRGLCEAASLRRDVGADVTRQLACVRDDFYSYLARAELTASDADLAASIGLSEETPVGWAEPSSVLAEAESRGLCGCVGAPRERDGRELVVAHTPEGAKRWAEVGNWSHERIAAELPDLQPELELMGR